MPLADAKCFICNRYQWQKITYPAVIDGYYGEETL
jgi:hypothetical protein